MGAHVCGSVCACTWGPEVSLGRVLQLPTCGFFMCVCLCVCICVLVLIRLCVRAFGGWRLKPGVFLCCFLPCSLSQVSQVNSELAASASLARQLGRGVHSPLSGLPHPPGTCMSSGHLNPVRQAPPTPHPRHRTVLSPTVLSEVGSLTGPGAAKSAKQAGQGSLGIHLSLPP